MTPAPARSKGTTIPAWGAWCFFASGAAALVYEVVWFKQLSYLLGNSLHAGATVVAAFLAGLAIGARFLGTPLARRGDGARMYALLELGVGVIGLVSIPALRALDPVVGGLYRGFGGENAAFGFARLGLMFVCLVPPAALMGATLPVLVAHFERGKLGPGLARLYAINTLGAVAGSVAGGFLLLPNLGLLVTTWVAAGLNLLVALVSWRAAGPQTTGEARESAAHAAQAAPILDDALTGAPRAVFAFAFALSGFAALVFQIAWVRLFALIFGSSVYSFAAVLGIYLTGLAIGAAAAGPLLRRGARLTDFVRLELALAALAAVMVHTFPLLPQWMYELVERSGVNWGALLVGEMMMVAGLILVPCALLGAVFPVATRLLQVRDGGHAAGLAYAVNTSGTIAGSLVAGFLLVPAVGVQGTHLSAVAITLATGLLVAILARTRGEGGKVDLGWGVVVLVAVGTLAFMAPRWDPALMSAGLYRPVQANAVTQTGRRGTDASRTVWRATRDERVLFYRDGINGSVLVATDPLEVSRWLRVGGKIDASTNDMETQVLVGLIPAMLADSGARTLVIGHGSGVTAAAVLAADAGPTEIIEIEPHVIEASRYFHAPGEDPLDDPRVKVILGDARTHLLHSGQRYDVIVSEPTNPWIAGVNGLFTVDFYRRVRERLEPGGVFGQWLQLYELSPETFRSLVSSLIEVFPDGKVFVVWRAVDILFVVAPPERRLAVERLSTPAGQRMLERAQIPSVDALAAYYAGTFGDMRDMARGATLNRDDLPVVEYRAPRDVIQVGRAALYGDPRVLGLLPFAAGPPEGPMFASWPADRWYEARAHFLGQQGDMTRAMMTVRHARDAGYVESADRLKTQVDALERRRHSMEAFDQSRVLSQANKPMEALTALERAVEIDHTNIRAWLVLGDKRRQAGDLAGAEAALAQAGRSKDPGILAEVEIVSGLIEIARSQPQRAAERFREAQKHTPDRAKAYALEARARNASGDRPGAEDALQRGLAAVPNDPELVATQRELMRQP